MELKKKMKYQAPKVVDFGDVAELTRNANQSNSDGQGTDSAFPNPS